MKYETNKRRNDRSIGTAPSELMALEPRIMLDAAAAAAGVAGIASAHAAAPTVLPHADPHAAVHVTDVSHAADPASADLNAAHHPFDPTGLVHFGPAVINPKAPNATPELVFVDQSIGNYQALVNDIIHQAQNATGGPRAIQIIELQSNESGILQITDALNLYHNVSAVHILSHNDHGNLIIGSTILNNCDLANYSSTFQSWDSHLSKHADILVYGCDVANGVDGVHFVNELAALTHTDVAANPDLTGSAQYNGDWTLSYHTGTIDVSPVMSASANNEWSGLLASPITVTETPSSQFQIVGHPGLYYSIAGQTLSFTASITNADAAHGGITQTITAQDLFTNDINFTALTVTDPNGVTTDVAGPFTQNFVLNVGTTATWTITGITTASLPATSSFLANDFMNFYIEVPTAANLIPYNTPPVGDNLVEFIKTADTTNALPGQTITYTLQVAGNNLSNVNITDVLNQYLSLVPGSVTVLTNTTVGDYAYSIIGNTEITVGTTATTPNVHYAGSLFTNDGMGAGSTVLELGSNVATLTSVASGIDTVLTAHGTAVVNTATGTFTYTPNAGYIGADAFSYQDSHTTVVNGVAYTTHNITTETFNASGQVWYVDTSAAPGGTGVSNNPFNSFAPLSGAGRPDTLANEFIYLQTPTSLAAAGGLILQSGETLVGTASALIVNAVTIMPATATYSMISGSNTNITLANNSTVEGVAINTIGTGGSGDTGILVSNTNGATITNVHFTFTVGSNVNGVFGDNVNGLAINNSTFSGVGTGINLSHIGSATIISNTFFGSPNYFSIQLVDFTGSTGAPIVLSNNTMTNPGEGILVALADGTTGNIDINNLTVDGTSSSVGGGYVNVLSSNSSTINIRVHNSNFHAQPSGSNMEFAGINIYNYASIQASIDNNRIDSVHNSIYYDGNPGGPFNSMTNNLYIANNIFDDNFTGFGSRVAINITETNTAWDYITLLNNTFSANYGVPVAGGNNYDYSLNLINVTTNWVVISGNDLRNSLGGTQQGVSNPTISIVQYSGGSFTYLTYLSNFASDVIAPYTYLIENFNLSFTTTQYFDGGNTGGGIILAPIGVLVNFPVFPVPAVSFAFTPISALTTAPLDPNLPTLTMQDLAPIIQEAIAYWQAEGISGAQLAAMQNATFNITDMVSDFLGGTSGSNVTIDINAANHGWFIDPTNTGFSTQLTSATFVAKLGDAAYGKIDLLTVVAHELANVAGIAETPYNAQLPDITANQLADGIRIIPTPLPIAGTNFDQQQLNNIVQAAISLWTQAGITSAQQTLLENTLVTVGSLNPAVISETLNNQIILSANAGGQGWFIDNSPLTNTEFGSQLNSTAFTAATNSAAGQGVDLLTAIMHEMGHILGYVDSSAATSLMNSSLTAGERFLPSLDASYASGIVANGPQFVLNPPGQVDFILSVVSVNGTTITYQAVVDPNVPSSVTTIDNTAGIVAPVGVTGVSNTVKVDVGALNVHTTVDHTTANTTDVLAYTVTVTNGSNTALTGITLTDTLDPNLTLTAPFNPGAFNLGAGATATFHFNATVNANTPLAVTTVTTDATATVLNPYVSGQLLTDVSNNALTTILHPTLTITETPATSTSTAGGQVTYTITLTNSGNGTANGVNVYDIFDANTTIVSVNGNTVLPAPLGNQELIASNVTLGAGGSVSYNVLVNVSPTIIPSVTTVTNQGEFILSGVNTFSNNAVTTILHPIMSVSDTTPTATAISGQQITYTITVSNTGTAAATGFNVYDIFDPNTSIVSINGNTVVPAPIGQTELVASNVSLAAGQSITYTVVAAVSPTTPISVTSVHNSGQVTLSGVNTLSGDAPTTILQPALNVTDSTPIASASAGDTVTYTVTVSNTGTAAAVGLNVYDLFDANTTLVSINGNTVLPAPVGQTELLATNVTLAAGGSLTFNIVATISPSIGAGITSITNQGEATLLGLNTLSTGAVTTILHPALSITDTALTPSASAGDLVNYTVIVTNTGTGPASGFNVYDLVDTNMTIISVNGNTVLPALVGQSELLASNQTLLAGHSLTYNIVASVSPTIGAAVSTVTNQGEVSLSGVNTFSPNASVNILHPLLSVTDSTPIVSASAGDTITYTVTVNNTGGATATGVNVYDVFDPNMTIVSINGNAVVPAPVGQTELLASGLTLTAGHSVTYTVVAKISPIIGVGVSTVHNQGEISVAGVNTLSADTVVNVLHPTLTVTDTTINLTASAADQITYSITFTNTGPGTAVGFNAYDNFDANTTIVSINGNTSIPAPVGQKELLGSNLTLGANQSVTYTVVAKVSSTISLSVNTVSNTGEVVLLTTDTTSTPPAVTTILHPTFTVTDTPVLSSASLGDNVTYTVTVTNTGPGTGVGFNVYDIFDANTSLVSINGNPAIPAPVGQTELLASNVTLAAGQSVIYTVVAHISTTTPTSVASVINQGEVTLLGANTLSINAVTNILPSYLTITDTTTNTIASPGNPITYTINVTNTGTGNAVGFNVLDVLDTNTTLVSVSLNGGATYVPVTPGLLGSNLTLAAGASDVFTVVTHVPNVVSVGATSITNTGEAVTILGATVQSTVTLPIVYPALSITDTTTSTVAVPGNPITYTIDVVNNGALTAFGLTVMDLLDPNTTVVSVSLNGGATYVPVTPGVLGTNLSLTSGAHDIFTVVANVAPVVSVGATSITNTGEVITLLNTTLQSSVIIPIAYPTLTITDTTTSSSAIPGGQVTYTVDVGNTGPGSVVGFSVHDVIDPNMTIVSVSLNGGATYVPVTPGLLASGLTLASGALDIFTVIANVIPSVSAGATTVTNHSDAVTLLGTTVNSNVSTPLNAMPDLILTNTITNVVNPYPSTTNPEPGSIVTYTLTATNIGNQDAAGIVLTDIFDPSTMIYSSANLAAGETVTLVGTNTLVINGVPVLGGVGGSTTLDLMFTVKNSVPASVYALVDTLGARDNGTLPGSLDPETAPVPVTVTNNLEFAPNLFVTKVGSPDVVVPGQFIDFTITVTNAPSVNPLENNTATNPIITEHIPVGTTFIASMNPGWTHVSGNIYQFTGIGPLVSGASVTEHIILQVNAPLPLADSTLVNNVSVVDAGLPAGAFEHTVANQITFDPTTVVMGNTILFAPDDDYYFDEGMNIALPEVDIYTEGQTLGMDTLDVRSNLMGARVIDLYDSAFGFWNIEASHIRTVNYDHSAATQEIYVSDIGQMFPGITPISKDLNLDQVILQKIDLMNAQLMIQPKGVDHDGSMPHNPAEHHNSDGSESATPILLQPAAPATTPEMPLTTPEVSFHNLSSQIANVSHRFDMASASLAAALMGSNVDK